MRINVLILIILHIFIILISCNFEPFPNGEKVYQTNCENCHMPDGTGLPPMYPSLLNSEYLNSNINKLPCIIRYGRKSEIMENVYMPPTEISAIAMSNLINYMTHKWGGSSGISLDEIEEGIKLCEDNLIE